MIIDEDGVFEKSINVTNLSVEKFKASMETTAAAASRLNGRNERNDRNIHNMVRSGLLETNQHTNKWYCASNT